jgi:hypothetical protein
MPANVATMREELIEAKLASHVKSLRINRSIMPPICRLIGEFDVVWPKAVGDLSRGTRFKLTRRWPEEPLPIPRSAVNGLATVSIANPHGAWQLLKAAHRLQHHIRYCKQESSE